LPYRLIVIARAPYGCGAEGVLCPWLTLLAAKPAAISGLVRVPYLAVARIPLQHGLMGMTVRAVPVCGLALTLGSGLRWRLRWRLDAEPLGGLLDLRLDTGEVHPA